MWRTSFGPFFFFHGPPSNSAPATVWCRRKGWFFDKLNQRAGHGPLVGPAAHGRKVSTGSTSEVVAVPRVGPRSLVGVVFDRLNQLGGHRKKRRRQKSEKNGLPWVTDAGTTERRSPKLKKSALQQPRRPGPGRGGGEGEARDQGGLEGVVGVGLAGPGDAAGGLGRATARGARSRARGRGRGRRCAATRCSYQSAYDESPVASCRAAAVAVASAATQCIRSRTTGRPGPVDGVDEPVGAVDGPALADRGVEQGPTASASSHVGSSGAEAGTQVQGQPGPLEPVADGGAVGAERVRGLVDVVLEQRASTSASKCSGIRQWCAGARSCTTRVSDPQRPVAQGGVVEHVGGREQRLDGVHVGVHAAVAVERGPRLVPLLDDHPVLSSQKWSSSTVSASSSSSRPPGRSAAVALAAASTTNACS